MEKQSIYRRIVFPIILLVGVMFVAISLYDFSPQIEIRRLHLVVSHLSAAFIFLSVWLGALFGNTIVFFGGATFGERLIVCLAPPLLRCAMILNGFLGIYSAAEFFFLFFHHLIIGCPLVIDGIESDRSGKYITADLTDFALKYIEKKRDNPFCLYLSHKAVHFGFRPPKHLNNLYDNVDLKLPPESDTWNTMTRNHLFVGALFPMNILYREYCETVVSVDEQVGRILEKLEEMNILDNTIITYAGDNGHFWGEHGLYDKRLAYAESIRIPFLIRHPKLIQKALGQGARFNSFCWQGGEPTLLGVEFYQQVVELQEKYRQSDQMVENALQTNGLLLDKAWCDVLNEHHILVGLSLDGPRGIHDQYRTGGRRQRQFSKGVEQSRSHAEKQCGFQYLGPFNRCQYP